MGKHSDFHRRSSLETAEEKRKIHPVWRGVGFALMLIVPFMAYAGAMLLLDANRQKGWFAIPQDLILKQTADPLLLVKVVATLVLSFLGFMVIFFVGLVISRLFGPARYGPYDAPPVKYKRRKK